MLDIPYCGEKSDILSEFAFLQNVASIELYDSADILSPISDGIYASMFINEKKYLVVSDLSDRDRELRLFLPWKDRETGITSNTFTVKKNNL